MVDSNVRRGTVCETKPRYIPKQFNHHEQKIIERTVLNRIWSAGREFYTDEYDQLLLDGIQCPEIFYSDKLFLELFTQLNTISFHSCGLKILSNFPILTKVVRIDLRDNRIISGLRPVATRCPQLKNLCLNNNNITELGELACFIECNTMVNLAVSGNPIESILCYSKKIF